MRSCFSFMTFLQALVDQIEEVQKCFPFWKLANTTKGLDKFWWKRSSSETEPGMGWLVVSWMFPYNSRSSLQVTAKDLSSHEASCTPAFPLLTICLALHVWLWSLVLKLEPTCWTQLSDCVLRCVLECTKPLTGKQVYVFRLIHSFSKQPHLFACSSTAWQSLLIFFRAYFTSFCIHWQNMALGDTNRGLD